jgi:Arc/MetJ-type ribon-helix-helix transcriptional regulator
MKERISATVEKETVKRIDRILKKGKYRNKSHIIEEALEIFEAHEEGQLKAALESIKSLGGLNE